MDFFLENVRTGEIVPLDAHRSLIGTADHSWVRLERGPFLGALFVNYPGGWSVHGLSDEDVKFNGKHLHVTQQVVPRPGDILEVAGEQFRLGGDLGQPEVAGNGDTLPSCFAYTKFPDGLEECRTVDHNLLFGRLRVCHVRYPDTKLSRLNALIASHSGVWYVHALGKGIIARNRHAISGYAVLEDGDELLIGPLKVRIEMQARAPSAEDVSQDVNQSSQETFSGVSDPSAVSASESAVSSWDSPTAPRLDSSTPSSVTDAPTLETSLPLPPEITPGLAAMYVSGVKLDQWLKGQVPKPNSQSHPGLAGWLETQRERLKRFWYDTPETTLARGLRTSGKPDEALNVLNRALRARPDSPDLLRELYRLYDSVGFHDLCFRPLRQIEKLAAARGTTDTWVLETLAQLCERLGRQRPAMFDRAVHYWTRLEKATGANYSQEKSATMAKRTICESGYAKIASDDQ